MKMSVVQKRTKNMEALRKGKRERRRDGKETVGGCSEERSKCSSSVRLLLVSA